MSKATDLIPDFSYVHQFERCPRHFYYAAEEGLEPRTTNVPLSAGAVIHDGLEVWYKTEDRNAALDALADSWDDEFSGWTAPRTCRCSGYKCKCYAYISLGHLEIVLKNFMDDHAGDPKSVVEAFDELFGERRFKITWDGLTVGGKIDLLQVTDEDQYYLKDFKTTTGRVNKWLSKKRAYKVSHQARLYQYAMESELDIELAGVVFHVIHTGEQAAKPDEYWDGVKSSRDRKFSFSRFSDEHLAETRAWLEQNLMQIQRLREDEERYPRSEFAWPQHFDNHCNTMCPFQEICWETPVPSRDGKLRHNFREANLTGELASGADSDE